MRQVDQHTLIDKKNGPFPGHVPFWWTPNKFDCRGPPHHKRAHHHTIEKDWYGQPTYDDKGNPKLPPSFYYDGVKEGEWHDEKHAEERCKRRDIGERSECSK